MSIFDNPTQSTPQSEIPIAPDVFEKDQNTAAITNVKRLTVDGGQVRIANGALIVTDETGVDRVMIGLL